MSHNKGFEAYPTHGIPFRLKYLSLWWVPGLSWGGEHLHLGQVWVRVWKDLRLSKALNCRLWVVAPIERVNARDTRHKPGGNAHAWPIK